MGATSAFLRTEGRVTRGVVKCGSREVSRSFGRVGSVEAALMLADLIREVEQPSPTIEDLLSSYVSSLQVEDSTVADYSSSKRAICHAIGGMSATEVARPDVQALVSSWLGSGRAVTTVRKRLRLLSAAYRDAMSLGIVERDPTEGVRVRREPRSRPNALVGDELARLRRDIGVADGWLAVAAMLGLLCGLREGEVCALTASDVDISSRTVTVRRSIGTGPSGEYVKATKTGRSRRIPLPEPLSGRLAPLVASVPPDAYLVGPSPSKWRSKWSLSSSWRSFAERGGYVGTEGRRPTFHDLRHTFATSLVASGVDIKAVQALMGHASAAMTLDTYAAFDVGRMPQLGREMDAIFGN